MTDPDILRRLQEVTGVGRIFAITPRTAHHKPSWKWAVQRRAHIRYIIHEVPPWLGARRAIAANQLLNRIAVAKDRAAA